MDHEDIARDYRDGARWEIGQTRTAQNTLLTALSFLGALVTGGGALLALGV